MAVFSKEYLQVKRRFIMGRSKAHKQEFYILKFQKEKISPSLRQEVINPYFLHNFKKGKEISKKPPTVFIFSPKPYSYYQKCQGFSFAQYCAVILLTTDYGEITSMFHYYLGKVHVGPIPRCCCSFHAAVLAMHACNSGQTYPTR